MIWVVILSAVSGMSCMHQSLDRQYLDSEPYYIIQFRYDTVIPQSNPDPCWWDPISPIHITNQVWHLCTTFAMIWDNSHSRMTKDDKKATLCNHFNVLYHSTILYSAPFHFYNLSNIFWCFWTICDILDFALFNSLPDCIAFSGAFHQTLFTWIVHHSFGFSGIILDWLALCFANVSCFILLLQAELMFLVTTHCKTTTGWISTHNSTQAQVKLQLQGVENKPAAHQI